MRPSPTTADGADPRRVGHPTAPPDAPVKASGWTAGAPGEIVGIRAMPAARISNPSPSRRSTRPRSPSSAVARPPCPGRIGTGRRSSRSASATSKFFVVTVRRDRDRRPLRRRAEDGRRASPGPVHRRRLAPDRRPGGGQRGRPRATARSYEVSREALRQILNQCPALSDIILQAFIARRQLLRESPDFTGLRVIGSRYSPDTFRVRDFLAKNRVLVHLARPRDRPGGGPAAQAVRGDRGRHAGGRLRAHAAAAQPVEPRAGRRDRHPPAAGAGGLRPGRRRRRTGGAGGRGLRRLRGAADGGAGAHGARAARPAAACGSRTTSASPPASPAASWPTAPRSRPTSSARASPSPRRSTRLAFDETYPVLHLDGGETVTAKCLLIATGADYRRLEVEGCERVRGRGRLLRRDAERGAAVPGQRGGRRRRRQLRRPGRRLPRRARPPGAAPDPRRRPLQEHVELPGPADRADAEHRAAPQHDDPAHGRRRPPRARSRSSTARRGRSATVRDAGGLQLHRGGAADRLAAAGDREGRQGVRPDRPGAGRSRPTGRCRRQPFLLETSRPGVFAAGRRARPARSSAWPRRSARASMAVQFVHEYLKEM